MERNILIRTLKERLNDFSRSQRLIALYILEHYEKAAYMTAAKLAEIVGVSESTVVRFAVELGYDGYPRMQKDLQELNKSKLTSIQRIEATIDRINDNNVVRFVLQSDIENIKKTLEDIDLENFNRIVDVLVNAEKVYIIGVRSSAPLAMFLDIYLNILLKNVRLVTSNAGELFEQIVRVSKNDVVIGISFPRYSTRTKKVMQFAKKQGAKVIAITDNDMSPIAENATYVLSANSNMACFVDSLVAPLSIVNALIVAIGLRKKNDTYNVLEKLESIWEEYNVYEKNDQ